MPHNGQSMGSQPDGLDLVLCLQQEVLRITALGHPVALQSPNARRVLGDASIAQLSNTGQPAALWLAVVAPLEHDVDRRVRDGVSVDLDHQRGQFRDVVIVHRAHRGQV